MQLETRLPSPLILQCGVPELEETGTVAEQIRDFLDGRTHGEGLLHALYDEILDEPVPQVMRALFQAGSAD
jgi:hypothetical protein